VQYPNRITVKDLEAMEGWDNAWRTTRKTAVGPEGPATAGSDSRTTPAEAIDAALAALNADVRTRLLAAVLKQSPEFFERLVLDVLIKMGYGGSREDAAQHLGRSGDEGIDGRINQDALGLDQILELDPVSWTV
jgi:restriction system protein